MLLIMITFSNFEFSLNANLLTESHEHLTKSQINLSKKKSFILIQEWVKGFSEIDKVTKNHARIESNVNQTSVGILCSYKPSYNDLKFRASL